jgi:hypothetical protein
MSACETREACEKSDRDIEYDWKPVQDLVKQEKKEKFDLYLNDALTHADDNLKQCLDDRLKALHRTRDELRALIDAHPECADWYVETCVDARAFEHHKNKALLFYTDDKLRRDFKHSGQVNYDMNSQHAPTAKCLLLREMLAVMNRGMPVQLKPHDLTLRQSDYDEDNPVEVSDQLWKLYRHHKRTRKTEKPQTRRDLMMCIYLLAKELFGSRFISRSETSKDGKKCYNFRTDEQTVGTTIILMNWNQRELGSIDQEIVQKYDLERRKVMDQMHEIE